MPEVGVLLPLREKVPEGRMRGMRCVSIADPSGVRSD